MDTGRNFFSGRIARILLGLSNFMILASSAILTGILAYFVHWRYRDTHVIYSLVIAVVSLFLYLFAMALPALKSYRGYMLPLTLVLTYLWLTSLIFSSQDWSGGRCRYSVFGYNNGYNPRCGLKHAAQAFWIIGFSFLFLNLILEALMWASHRSGRVPGGGGEAEKDRPLTTPAGTTAGGTDGERAAQTTV